MKIFYFLFALLFAVNCNAQLMGFNLPKGVDKVEVPFTYQNNFIIIDVIFDNVFPLKFIFDTGSENTILVKKEFTDVLNISYEREFKILGADFETELVAYLIRQISIDLPNLPGPKLDMLVLQDDYFQFEVYTGLKIHGILGMDLFKTFVIEIDYQKQKLIFHRIEKFKVPSKKFESLDIEIHRSKPYFLAQAKMNNDTVTDIKLLLDTGASLSLMLHNNSSKDIRLPKKMVPGKIGNGLGGYIHGFVGRINQLAFGNFNFNSVITNFQEINPLADSYINYGRNGILGNEVLSRFRVIFDFAKAKVHFKPIRKYNKSFKYDKSGLILIASGKNLDEFSVKEIIPSSPAEEAGLQIGDIVKNINYTRASFYDLKNITKIFQKRTNKRIRLMVHRNGERMVFKFRLRDLI